MGNLEAIEVDGELEVNYPVGETSKNDVMHCVLPGERNPSLKYKVRLEDETIRVKGHAKTLGNRQVRVFRSDSNHRVNYVPPSFADFSASGDQQLSFGGIFQKVEIVWRRGYSIFYMGSREF